MSKTPVKQEAKEGRHAFDFDVDRVLDADGLSQLREVVKGKTVLLIGGLRPDTVNQDDYDLVVRLNDWWPHDYGRCDVMFHIGASPKLKVAWLLNELREKADLKLFMLFQGAEHEKMRQILRFQKVPTVEYDFQTAYHRPLRAWFNLRGNSPSTGLISLYTLLQCDPRELVYTGADLYASEPDHIGWARHSPLAHCYWLEKLAVENNNLFIAQDVWNGIKYWREQEVLQVGEHSKGES